MMFYLENTDILAKRMVSATPVVEPHLPESEARDVLGESNTNKDIDVYFTFGKFIFRVKFILHTDRVIGGKNYL